ncbi:protoporphyrinogen oxidase HemJ [Candidatus Pelagibacter sp. HIMB1517]|uniref:protoporphyrinogen oxidase HemJ n=1 Tax=Candidatus Pelagibacter sp. HIMB1517 TaxID=3413341 RepID=UPI003F868E91
MYEWIKVLHIISFVAWFAGLFYLPRLYVYHAENADHDHTRKTLETMEYKLLKFIMNPAMIATWIFGVALIHYAGSAGWLHAKITLVVILSAFHMYLGVIRKKLINEPSKYSSKYFRYINEVPTVLLILIVILVVVKPF